MITRGLLTNTIVTRGYGIHLVLEIGKACLEFTRKMTVVSFSRVRTIRDFVRGCHE